MGHTTEFDFDKINDEFLNTLRHTLQPIDNKSRISEKTITIVTTTAKIYNINTKISYIKSATLDNVLLVYGKDYTINYRGANIGSIELTIAPTALLNLVVVYGEVVKNNFIYSDFPRGDLSEENYPRIGFKITWSRTMAGLPGAANTAILNTGFLQIKIIDVNKVKLSEITTFLDNFLISNFRGFYFIRYIDPKSYSSYDNFDDNTENTFYKILEYELPVKLQIR